MQTKKLTFSALLVAIGVMAGNIIYIPVGAAKCFPVQHTINVISGEHAGYRFALGFSGEHDRSFFSRGPVS